MANLIPLAGEGKRFADAGFTVPKVMVEVSGMPMIVKTIRDMPPSNKWIFVVRQEHIDKYSIDKILRAEIKDAIIIPLSKTTDGPVFFP